MVRRNSLTSSKKKSRREEKSASSAEGKRAELTRRDQRIAKGEEID